MFSVRIVNADHYISSPKPGLDITYSQFRGNQVKSVPVIRIFGASSSGEKTCLHIHGVFPYILVPFSGAQDAGSVMYQLATSLDKALNVSLGSSYSNKQYVFKITQVSGRPFYGYHGQDHQFLKIFFYTPLIVKRACDLLQSGAVCGTRFQIHEGHVPYILQFFIDYNLYGMSFIKLKQVVYRKGSEVQGAAVGTIPKESYCKLEADAVAVDILNRIKSEGELAVNPGLAAIWEEEKKRLNKDHLDCSQRLTPPVAMSEVLLKEKLLDNLKLQGKFKARLKENIPYPAETQTSDILEASMLDTHSISSLVSSGSARVEQPVVDEELIMSLSQNILSSGEMSLLAALDTLAEHNESTTQPQAVEEDSILGSQIVADSLSDDDDILDYSLQYMDSDSDASFDGNIPQLDGLGDIIKKKKFDKKPFKENQEVNQLEVNSSEISICPTPELKTNRMWQESENQDIDEVFQDIEPFCSPLHDIENMENVLECDVDLNPVTNFNSVLKGDPSFTSRESTFSEDVFLEDKSGSDFSLRWSIDTKSLTSSRNTPSKDFLSKITTDFESSLDTLSSPEDLNASQLDALFDGEDLKERLESITSNIINSVDETDVNEILEESMVETQSTRDSNIIAEVSTDIEIEISNKCLNESSAAVEVNDKCTMDKLIHESDVNVETEGGNNANNETLAKLELSHLSNSDVDEKKQKCVAPEKKKNTNISAVKTSPCRKQVDVKSPLKKMIKHLLTVKNFRKMKTPFTREDNYWDMTDEEVSTYFAQLNKMANSVKLPTFEKEVMFWPAIRKEQECMVDAGKETLKKSRKNSKMGVQTSTNIKKSEPEIKMQTPRKPLKKNKSCVIKKKWCINNNISKKEMKKILSCCVILKQISNHEISSGLKTKKGSFEDSNKVNNKFRRDKQIETSKDKLYSSDTSVSTDLIPKVRLPEHLSKSEPIISKNAQFSSSDDDNAGSNSQKEICNFHINKGENSYCKALFKDKSCQKIKQFNQSSNHKRRSVSKKDSRKNCTVMSKDEICNTKVNKKETLIKENNKVKKTENSVKQKRVKRSNCKEDFPSASKMRSCNVLVADKSIPRSSEFAENQSNYLETESKKKRKLNNCLTNQSIQTTVRELPISVEDDEEAFADIYVEFNPIVKIQKLEDHEIIHNHSANRRKSLPNPSDFSKNKICNSEKSTNSRRYPRRKSCSILTLDGTCDGSSSDDNVTEEHSADRSTPNKKMKSSNRGTKTPKTKYAPLQVEIKKSPTIKLQPVDVPKARLFTEENKSNPPSSSCSKDSQAEEDRKERRQSKETVTIEPVLKIEKLPQCVANSNPIHKLKMTTKSHPIVKKLKVSIRRLSTDVSGTSNSKNPKEPAKKHFRSLSLPETSK